MATDSLLQLLYLPGRRDAQITHKASYGFVHQPAIGCHKRAPITENYRPVTSPKNPSIAPMYSSCFRIDVMWPEPENNCTCACG
jgi:hypothetical protein